MTGPTLKVGIVGVVVMVEEMTETAAMTLLNPGKTYLSTWTGGILAIGGIITLITGAQIIADTTIEGSILAAIAPGRQGRLVKRVCTPPQRLIPNVWNITIKSKEKLAKPKQID
jgi:hypothetical protein